MTWRCAKCGLFGRGEEFPRNGFKVAIQIDAFHVNAHFASAGDRDERNFARVGHVEAKCRVSGVDQSWLAIGCMAEFQLPGRFIDVTAQQHAE